MLMRNLLTRYAAAKLRPTPSAAQYDYTLWSDPDFWALCTLLADTCQEQLLKQPALPEPSPSVIFGNPSCETMPITMASRCTELPLLPSAHGEDGRLSGTKTPKATAVAEVKQGDPITGD